MPARSLEPVNAANVCVRDLVKRYGSVEAVREVTFEVAAGEIFGLLGPNGAGKTTTLECVLGLRRPDSGAIEIGGVDAIASPASARQFVGAQLQSATLQDKITARQALKLFASFYAEPASIGELIERFALAEKADAAFASLSGGQKQRVFLALAFVNNPRLVVLDEPTAGLDPQSRRELHRVITGMRAAGRMVLLSTHDLNEAHRLCDRIGIIDHGRIVAIARPDELIARARATPRVTIRTAKPLDSAGIATLDGVLSSESRAPSEYVVTTRDPSRTITALMKQLESADNRLLDLQIRRPSLEDVFIELTGRAWSESIDEAPDRPIPRA